VDWNNDGKIDIIAGDASGKVWLFINKGTPTEPILAAGINLKAGGVPINGTGPRYERDKNGKYQFIPNKKDIMGIYSKIHVGDWDGDGKKDLLVGQDGPNRQKLLLYKNIGTDKEPILDSPTELKIPKPGMSRPSPYLVDWDGDGKQDLLCGTERPMVYFFRNIGTPEKPEFTQVIKTLDLKGEGFSDSYRCRIDVTDWNNDGILDLLIGTFYSNVEPAGGNVWLFLGK
jgi:hypothetical protein